MVLGLLCLFTPLSYLCSHLSSISAFWEGEACSVICTEGAKSGIEAKRKIPWLLLSLCLDSVLRTFSWVGVLGGMWESHWKGRRVEDSECAHLVTSPGPISVLSWSNGPHFSHIIGCLWPRLQVRRVWDSGPYKASFACFFFPKRKRWSFRDD